MTPPSVGGLDWAGREKEARVGSHAVREHIAARDYLLTLHGHIHESPSLSGRWYETVGNTVCVQPGACPPKYVVVDLNSGQIESAHGITQLPCRDSCKGSVEDLELNYMKKLR